MDDGEDQYAAILLAIKDDMAEMLVPADAESYRLREPTNSRQIGQHLEASIQLGLVSLGLAISKAVDTEQENLEQIVGGPAG